MATAKKEKKSEVEYDKKKIILFVVVAVFAIFILLQAKSYILGDTNTEVSKINSEKKVKGIAAPEIPNDVRESFQNKITEIKDSAENLDLVEVASSSPQVQKIINDIKSLKDLPKSQLKQTCEKVCGSL